MDVHDLVLNVTFKQGQTTELVKNQRTVNGMC